MRFGISANLDKVLAIKNAGYDYMETALSCIAAMTDQEFAEKKKAVELSGLKVEAVNGFFPGDMPILDDNAVDRVREYTAKALKRAAELGTKIAVMGSGAARRKPDDMRDETFGLKFERLLKLIVQEAEKCGIIVVVEPLNKTETNTVNTVADAKMWCQRIDSPNLKLLADTYHMYQNGEGYEELASLEGMLTHLHIARGSDRLSPNLNDKEEFDALVKILNDIGYNQRVTVEARFREDFENEIKETKKFLNIFN